MDLLDKGIITYIPFGMVTGSSLLYNLGPKIPVKLSLVGDVVTGFSTDVTEYGINNALIKLMIDVKVVRGLFYLLLVKKLILMLVFLSL